MDFLDQIGTIQYAIESGGGTIKLYFKREITIKEHSIMTKHEYQCTRRENVVEDIILYTYIR